MSWLRKRQHPPQGQRRGAAPTASDQQTQADGAPPQAAGAAGAGDTPIGYNPNREETLYWRTAEGYIIAHDVMCQYEYIQACECPDCGGPFRVAAHLNRSGQGLSELVALCEDCGARANFIFDISNDVFQAWWAEQLGSLYVCQYDAPPREPYEPE